MKARRGARALGSGHGEARVEQEDLLVLLQLEGAVLREDVAEAVVRGGAVEEARGRLNVLSFNKLMEEHALTNNIQELAGDVGSVHQHTLLCGEPPAQRPRSDHAAKEVVSTARPVEHEDVRALLPPRRLSACGHALVPSGSQFPQVPHVLTIPGLRGAS